MTKLEDLITAFSKLQGIGKKSATRIAFDFLSKKPEDVNAFLNVLKSSYETIKPCKICQSLTDTEICDICRNPKGIIPSFVLLKIQKMYLQLKNLLSIQDFIMF